MNLINRIQSILGQFDLTIRRVGFPKGPPIDVLGLLLQLHPGPRGPKFQVLQIGANDGKTNDPIHDFIIKSRCSGVLVEPIPDVFAKLAETYRGVPGIRLENCAIAEADGTATLYRVRPDERLPRYMQELASFDKRVILKQRRTVPEIAHYITTIDVPAKTVRTLLDKHQIRHVHLLVSDTEGFDYHVLKMVFDAGVLPDLISVEVSHLKPAEKALAARLLVEGQYRYLSLERDIVAVKQSVLDLSLN